MKAAMFRKDGVGGVVGRLCAPDMIQYENDGHIGTFKLTGKVKETEYNDVLVVGVRYQAEDGSDCIDVQNMESLPTRCTEQLKFKITGELGNAYCVAFRADNRKEVTERVSDSGVPYTEVSFSQGKNSTFHINVMGEYEERCNAGVQVFLLSEAPKRTKREVGSGYAKKEIIADYAMGRQLMS